MKIIIASGRDYPGLYDDFEESVIDIVRELDLYLIEGISEIIHGCCPTGADALAQEFIERNELTASHFPAEWNKYGKAAGPMRNKHMVEAGDLLIAFWDGKSRGTGGIIQQAERASLPTHIMRY